jgi:3-hydroxyisobutyrate dehydrogenase
MRVGFIGLGHIGADMAKSLAAPPFELTVFDVAPAPLGRFEGIARLGGSAADVGRHSEIVSVCVRDDTQLRAVLTGPRGLLEGLGKRAIILVHSTVRAATIRELTDGPRALQDGRITADHRADEPGSQHHPPWNMP